jgi:putative glutamine amidotransferase
MSRPIIAHLARFADSADTFSSPVAAGGRHYIDAVVRAGGQPVLVPPTRDALQVADLLSRVDGVLIAGGGDVNPSRYGEEPHPTVYNVDDLNDDFEIEVVKACVHADKPLLAICRGHQVLNVALGGTLVQHIDDHEQHRGVVRRASIDSQSHVARAMGTTESNGLCWHHQAVRTLGTALRVVARASDGVIEAVEHTTSSWIVGVQWHPEQTAATDMAQQSLFDELVRRSSRQ